MRYVKPYYYDDFKCTAAQCPDTCCAGWQIVIDEEALEKYGKCNDEFGMRLKNSIDWQEGCFYQNKRRCAMLSDNNLCDLIIAKGEGWLCTTCARYPRHTEEFDGVREYSLSLSCPVAADMMLQSTQKLEFIIEEDGEADPLEEEFEEFDFFLFSQLEDARNVIFSIVQNRELPIGRRMEMVTKLAAGMQKCVDENRLFDVDELLSLWKEKVRGRNPEDMAEEGLELTGKERFESVKYAFGILTKLERLREEWTDVLAGAESTLYTGNFEKYDELRKAFYEDYVETLGKDRWEIFLEQILMFFLYTYFCGAVYDDCIYSKVVLSTFSVCFIAEFIMSRWCLNDKKLDFSECINLAYRYAREIEHSDENLIRLEEWIMDEFLNEESKF